MTINGRKLSRCLGIEFQGTSPASLPGQGDAEFECSRKGDCCTLLRNSVDLPGGFVSGKTSKTRESIQIPIFPLFRRVLEKALA